MPTGRPGQERNPVTDDLDVEAAARAHLCACAGDREEALLRLSGQFDRLQHVAVLRAAHVRRLEISAVDPMMRSGILDVPGQVQRSSISWRKSSISDTGSLQRGGEVSGVEPGHDAPTMRDR